MMDDMVSHHELNPAALPSGVLLNAYATPKPAAANPASPETRQGGQVFPAYVAGLQRDVNLEVAVEGEHGGRVRRVGGFVQHPQRGPRSRRAAE